MHLKRGRWVLLLIPAVASFSIVYALARQALPPRPADVPGGSLDPDLVSKYVSELVIPPVMPRDGVIRNQGGKNTDFYVIGARQFEQQVLPPGLPMTTVYGYGSVRNPSTFHYPSFTIEAKWERPVRVKWVNELVDESGNFLPPIVPVDQTIHWANPPGGIMGRDMRGMDGTAYQGPVPIVTHLHGAHVLDDSDGAPEAWYLPAAANIPSGYATVGSDFDALAAGFQERTGIAPEAGSVTYEYSNDQRATTLWYHDHAIGMTRTNVYSGLAGFYMLRGGPDDLDLGYRAPKENDAMKGVAGRPQRNILYTEVPLAIQDRSFNADGSLFFPGTREFFDGFAGPYAPDPDSDIAPIWNPEFFGNMMVVNGQTWPTFTVEARRYRFHFLNGCNSRVLILKIATDDTPADGRIDDGNWTALSGPFWVIGTEGGFLPDPVQLDDILMAGAERFDTIIDFAAYEGQTLYLVNVGPDEPFGGGEPGEDFEISDPDSTGQVMRFVVKAATSPDLTAEPASLSLPALNRIGNPSFIRPLSLNELDSELLSETGPLMALLGVMDFSEPEEPAGVPIDWDEPLTEDIVADSTEIWEIYNFTMDAHPIHLHLVQFEVVNREIFDEEMPGAGTVRLPEVWERGFKDTAIAYPGEILRIKARFDLPGLYVWHCHIVDHEDNSMMRPYIVR